MSPEARERMVLWARGQICAVCNDADCQLVLGHHVLYQQWLRDAARTQGINPVPLLEDDRGWLAVGDSCHQRHHSAMKRITRDVLERHCPHVFEFANELGLGWRLDRFYPAAVVV